MWGRKIGNNSVGVQAGRDVVIGLTYSDVKDIAYDLFQQNFPSLVKSAADEARKNVDEYVSKLEEKLRSDINTIDIQKFAKANTQYVLNESIRSYAKKGKSIDVDVLTEALIASLQKNPTEMLDIVSEQVLSIIPNLTKQCHQILSLLHYFLNVKMSGLKSIADSEFATSKLLTFVNVEEELNELTLTYMQSLGLVSINQFVGIDPYDTIKSKYSEFSKERSIEIFTTEVKLKCPCLSKIAEYFNKYHLGRAMLTPSGMLIALINLKRVLGPMDYKIWIK